MLLAMESLRKKTCPMENRVETLEHNVALIRQDLSVVLSNYVTKADLHREISQQTGKVISWTIS